MELDDATWRNNFEATLRQALPHLGDTSILPPKDMRVHPSFYGIICRRYGLKSKIPKDLTFFGLKLLPDARVKREHVFVRVL